MLSSCAHSRAASAIYCRSALCWRPAWPPPGCSAQGRESKKVLLVRWDQACMVGCKDRRRTWAQPMRCAAMPRALRALKRAPPRETRCTRGFGNLRSTCHKLYPVTTFSERRCNCSHGEPSPRLARAPATPEDPQGEDYPPEDTSSACFISCQRCLRRAPRFQLRRLTARKHLPQPAHAAGAGSAKRARAVRWRADARSISTAA